MPIAQFHKRQLYVAVWCYSFERPAAFKYSHFLSGLIVGTFCGTKICEKLSIKHDRNLWVFFLLHYLQRGYLGEKNANVARQKLSHCRHKGLVMIRDEAHLRWGHRNDQSCRGHQCSKTMLTGESRFHTSPPRGFEPRSLVMGSKRVVHWISETWWEWSEIAGSPHKNC